jgi:hypothetical protein
MPQSQEYTDTFIITYKLFLVGLRGRYFISNPDGRPCIAIERDGSAPFLSGLTINFYFPICSLKDAGGVDSARRSGDRPPFLTGSN